MLKPVDPLPNASAYWKIDKTIRHCLDNGYRKFIIFPFGENGLQVKNILNTSYGIKEALIVDTGKSKYNPDIMGYEDFIPTGYYDDAVVLLSATPPESEAYYLKAIKKIDSDRVVCPFDDSLNKDSARPKVVRSVLDSPEKVKDGCIKLSFVGDLILLENMVKSARKQDGGYDFSHMFRYTKKYLEDSDLSIGVLEGPCSNEGTYTQGNFDDRAPLSLNFPKQYLKDIKDAGIGLVTTCNNHAFDRGLEGLLDTLDNLDAVGLDHVGTYRNKEESSRKFIKDIKGVKVGFIAYSYGFNKAAYNIDGKWAPYTRKIVNIDDPAFESVSMDVVSEIAELKGSCDIVVVLSHMGKDFTHRVSKYEQAWSDLFMDAGADIMFNCHAHAVKKVTIKEGKLRAFCPGNYMNSIVSFDGDSNAIIEAYVDIASKKVVASSVVPIITYFDSEGTGCAVPIPDLYNGEDICRRISPMEKRQIERASEMVTRIMTGIDMPAYDYYSCRPVVTEEGNGRTIVRPLDLVGLKGNRFLEMLEKADSVCFVGDSVTEGTSNGGIPWYEPIVSNYPNLKVVNVSKGGITSKGLLPLVSKARFDVDVAVIAVGCNDIRYRSRAGALTPEGYVVAIESMVSVLRKKAKQIVLVTPWPSTRFDPFCPVPERTKHELYDAYSKALKDYCIFKNLMYSDPYPAIREYFEFNLNSPMLVDHIHPTAKGTEMYSRLFLECMHDASERKS